MRNIPVVLSIAGSDCSGGAGIQADIKTISALGGYAATAITSVTVQNTCGVQSVYPLLPDVVRGQIVAVMDDLYPEAVKIGMLGDAGIVSVVVSCLSASVPVVYDPVMVSSSGRRLMTEDAIEAVKKELFPLVTLLTPNLDEASVLTDTSISTLDEMKQAARMLTERYGFSVLLKGGHLAGDEMCDVLHTADHTYYIYKEQRIETGHLHGTGCTLSSAIAARLAAGCSLPEAVEQAKAYVTQAIREGKDLGIGQGNGPLWHFPAI